MPRNFVKFAVFLVGLAAVCGIALGYIVSNPLAFAVTVLIGACYVVGALELRRFQQATEAFVQALDALLNAPKSLAIWIDTVPPGLRNAVRARVEGERAGLPGPALTPYLVGLLVLLGMLGTLLGMVVTLHGTGAALESATDLSAIRASLAAPVTGLGFAFGTSIAGVATSAMLGLLSALCRRERLHAAHALDTKIATTLRAFTQTHQREEAFKLMQKQADLMPALADHLHAMMRAIEQHSLAAHERQIASQGEFHAKTETAYRRLATSVELSLKQSVADSARAASVALQPVMQATMDGIARETAALHGTVEQAVTRQLDSLNTGFEASAAKVADIWNQSLDAQRVANEALTEKFEARSMVLVDGIATQMSGVREGLDSFVIRQREVSDAQTDRMAASLDRFAGSFEQRSTRLVADVSTEMAGVKQGLDRHVEHLSASMERFATGFEQRSTSLVDGIAARMEHATSGMSEAWQTALAQQTSSGEQLAAQHEQALAHAAATFEGHAASLLGSMNQAHAALRTEIGTHHDARLSAWTDALGALAATLRDEWQSTSAFAAGRQQDICDTLARTASEISEQSKLHANETIAQIGQLVQAASEAPKAAAEVIAELRQKLSDSMVRDTAMLDERARLLATLETLLDAVNHASTEQRAAVDALVTGSADLLERVGAQFTGKVDVEAAKLSDAAAHVTSGVVEVASLADAFGAAVQAFGESNETLVAQLQRIEGALDKSLARSDEQLAYYVAQAREVIDLSMMSQKQIVENLQHLAGERGINGAKAA